MLSTSSPLPSPNTRPLPHQQVAPDWAVGMEEAARSAAAAKKSAPMRLKRQESGRGGSVQPA